MAAPGNTSPERRRGAAKRHRREAQLLDAFAALRRSDRRVHDALVTIIRRGDVRILDAVAVVVDFVFRAAWRRARQGEGQPTIAPRPSVT
jgi:hypothetical protein